MRNKILKKIKACPKIYFFLAVILLVGLFLRFFKLKILFAYNHDNDLASWIVKDIVFNKHLRLIGQETSTPGVFIGSLYYYLLIPFYLLFNMDPIAAPVFTALLGVFTAWSFYFVFSKVFNKQTGLIGALIYAVSLATVLSDKWAVPTMPVMLWSVWYLYAIDLLLKGKQKASFILFGILLGLIWHLSFILVLLVPVIPVAFFLSQKRLKWKPVLIGVAILLAISLPLIVFELRHGFSQTQAFLDALMADQGDSIKGLVKFEKVLNIFFGKASGLFWTPPLDIKISNISNSLVPLLLLVVLSFFLIEKILSKKLASAIFLWLFFYLIFFTTYSKTVSEYYLDGIVVIWIALLAFLTSYLLKNRGLKFFGIGLLSLIIVLNFYRVLSLSTSNVGYIERKAIVSYIKQDAKNHNYPCVAISYMTNPGYELGYRYLFWLEDMHVNKPIAGSPVYTIVYPRSRAADRVTERFGDLGLVLPEYERYNNEEVKESCSGANSNLTDPMFGYTE